MATFVGRVKELENVLIDNFVAYKSHTCFFLSHCHSDHMQGLDELFSDINKESNNYIYCSSISRLILLNRYGCVYKKVIIELTSPKMLTVPGNNTAPSYQMTVTPIPAGHCLGSVMFLFETVTNTILYTGDFRLFKNDISSFKPFHSKNQIKLIDTLYVDSTFLNDCYWDFPSRSEVATELLKLVKSWIYKSPNHNVLLVTSALYGYEFVFIELAKNLKCKIHVKDALHKLFYNIPEVGCFLTNDCKSTRIHASCNFDKKCLSVEDEKVLRVKLSAQWYKASKNGPLQKMWKEVSKRSILFCYSTHCSCSELVDFINYLQPKKIEPCSVAVGSTEEDVNISNTWFLPQEGFPVFYRYFNEKVTWNEAEAICSFHHADLLSVETSNQMDAARAYLKEMDVTDNVWIGLQKESPEKPFSWTNGDKLLGDGYWTEPIPKTNEKLCAAIDPVADFRWNSFYCRGPQLASFVCELPVPEWAKKENGCLITSLPSLTVTLIPEVGVIQLLSDCGLDGTRRIACSAGLNREEIIKRLSCDVDAFASTIFSRSTTAGTVREINTQQSPWTDVNNLINRHETTKTFLAHTRHRRSVDTITTKTANTSFQGTSPPPKTDKMTSTAFINVPPRVALTSPYLASAKDAQTTGKPQNKMNSAMMESTNKHPQPPSSTVVLPNGSAPVYKDLPVLIITGEANETSSATSENPPIVLMIENKNLEEPFLVPLSEDILINPSLSPVEVINVDLVEVDNLTKNGTNDEATPIVPPEAPSVVHPLKLTEATTNSTRKLLPSKSVGEDAAADSLNTLEEDKGAEIPQKPNRGRILTHSSHPSFYPRFLNRVLG